MDPENNLKQQAVMAAKITAIVDSIDEANGPTIAQEQYLIVFAGRLAELSTAYCEWVQKGGFTPVPEPAPVTVDNSALLAKEVYEVLYHYTEYFAGSAGAHVAYLVGGILTGQGIAFHDQLEEGEQAFVDILRDCFEDDHAVWKWVDLTEATEISDEEDEL